MARYIIIILFSLCSTVMSAQGMSYKEIFDKYSKSNGCTSVSMNAKMIDMMAEKNEDPHLRKLLRNIKSITILTVPAANNDFKDEIKEYIQDESFSNIKSYFSDGKSDDFYFYDGYKSYSHFMMISSDKNFTTLIRITGYFSIKDISKLSKIAM